MGIDPSWNPASMSELAAVCDARCTEVQRLRMQCEDELRRDISNNALVDCNTRSVKLAKRAYYASQLLRLVMSMDSPALFDARGSQSEEDPIADFCEMVRPYRSPDDEGEEKLTKLQRLLLHVLRYAWQMGYRRNGDHVYEQVRANGVCISAWKRVCTLEELVYRSARRTERFDQWLNLTGAANNAAHAVAYLRACDDHELPPVRQSRHIFAFDNGVYITAEDRFFPHGARLPDAYNDMAAAKHFPTDLSAELVLDVGNWREIATPHFQSILVHQEFDVHEVDAWMYVAIGRMLYEVGERDNWQVIPFLKGMAGSGKSTILLNVCKLLFDEADVGVLSNNIERKFGLWGFCNKKLFIAPEIKTDLHLDQAEFQSLVSGDAMQVAQKNVQSVTVEWKVPGIMAGNEVPAWRDAAGSIARRILLFHFSKSVVEVDTQLGEKLRREMPSLIVKCNRAYLAAVAAVSTRNIWAALPKYFTDTQRDLQACVDSLWNFLSAGELEFGQDMYMPWEAFTAKYREYCRVHGIPFSNLNKTNLDSYTRTLAAFKCSKESVRVERFYPRSSCLVSDRRVGFWVVGLDEPPQQTGGFF